MMVFTRGISRGSANTKMAGIYHRLFCAFISSRSECGNRTVDLLLPVASGTENSSVLTSEVENVTSPIETTLSACTKCCASFTSDALLKRHKVSHHTESRYKCSQCQASFVSKQSFSVHKRGHIQSFACSDCDVVVKSTNALERHRQAHHSGTEMAHVCSSCSQKFPLKTTLQNHIRTVHQNTFNLVCCQCGKGFRQLANLFRHLHEHKKNGTLITCEECMCMFKSAKEFNYGTTVDAEAYNSISKEQPTLTVDSTAANNDTSEEQGSTDDSSVGAAVCQICNRAYISQDALEAHNRRTHAEGILLTCEECRKVFQTKEGYELHKTRNNHSRCNVCARVFETLKLHLAHAKESGHILSCTKCEATFSSIDAYRRHQNSKHGTLLACEECGKAFPTEERYEHHKRHNNHSRCITCGHVFETFKLHLGHVKESGHPLSCTKCEKTFASIEGYRRHQNSKHRQHKHSFECLHCGYACSSAHELNNHMRAAHMGETPFRCIECAMCFASRTELIRHVRIAHLLSKQTSKAKSSDSCKQSLQELATAVCLKPNLHSSLDETIFHPALVEALPPDDESSGGSTGFTFFCAQCSDSFNCKSELQQHVLMEHCKETEDNVLPSERFKCSECSSCFDSSFSLQLHAALHHNGPKALF